MDRINWSERHIDHNFYRVSHKEALQLLTTCPGKPFLPQHGYQRKVLIKGKTGWLQRTPVNGQYIWAVHVYYGLAS